MLKKIIPILLIALTFQITSCFKSDSDKLQIYSIKYGDSMYNKKFIYYANNREDGKEPFSWKFYLIRYNGKNILVDTGFGNRKLATYFNIQNFKDPIEILKENGIEPEKVTHILLTHSHFDHAGNIYRFPNAQVYLNKDVLNNLSKNISTKGVHEYLKKKNNYVIFDNQMTLLNILKVEKIGGHTSGSSVVFLDHGHMKYCFTGDEVYLSKNLELRQGSGTVFSHKKNMEFINRLSKSDYKPLLFHQPDFKNYDKNFVLIDREK